MMYVTRSLSLYKNNPSELSAPPPAGPNSGILIVQDIKAERRCCFSVFREHLTMDLPFPQNKKLNLEYSYGFDPSEYHDNNDYFYAVFIPVLDLPLSSHRYYIIQTRGEHAGKAYTSSSEEEKATFCCCKVVRDVPPRQFNPNNTYQQFQIIPTRSLSGHEGFEAISMAADGIPPFLFRRPGWTAHTSKIDGFDSMEAHGVDSVLRSQLPDFNFPLPCKISSPVVVGKWYCPYIFIRDGDVDVQMDRSMYYEMTLEQSWEEIFECENFEDGNRVVEFGVSVEKEVVVVLGKTVAGGERDVGNGFVWFSPAKIGLSLAIVERIKWQEEEGGFEWVEEGKEKEVKVKRREEFEGVGIVWKRFGCYVLVERFVLKRLDGTLVLSWEFRHTHQIRTKWWE
ncbi:uncharacterized protein LOC120081844 [Benincasa hispida]|uniref:uncharacterized protein LOC120081844 n=1 Tax=Benincasa hispida TaxID=102211 RepID=UPI001901D55F|nr:uncharacterized protein LOC120081844 [Benincasa hispida]